MITSESVKYQRVFNLSLLKWSNCSYRFAVNGCSRKEIKLLQRLCDSNPRLELIVLPFKGKVGLGTALTYLQSIEKSSFFAFLDPDILATGFFMNDILKFLKSHNAVFSALPVWLEENENIFPIDSTIMHGKYDRNTDHYIVGGTYLAIYHNNQLTELLHDTGIDFRRYFWKDIPDYYKLLLVKRGLKAQLYDVGKLMNILLNEKEGRLKCVELENLRHIGGLSYYVGEYQFYFIIKEYLKKINLFLQFKRIDKQKKRIDLYNKSIKIEVNRYFSALLYSLFKNKKLPALPFFNSYYLNQKIKKVSDITIQSYKEFKELF